MPVTDDAYLRVLQLLQQQPDLSQRQLAARLGVCLGKTNYLLRALLEKGSIKARNFRNSQNKLAYAYLLTPQGVAQKTAMTKGYLQRKTAEYEALRAEIESLRREIGVQAQSSQAISPGHLGEKQHISKTC
jgi:EPS-associated MarR family transcriptional regulator